MLGWQSSSQWKMLTKRWYTEYFGRVPRGLVTDYLTPVTLLEGGMATL